MNPLDILRTTFGFSEFRGVQQQVIDRVMAGQHSAAIMPTGAGKSLCYQLPALARPGTGLVISPLIALMHDQIRSAKALGIRAAALTSADSDRDETIARFRAGALAIRDGSAHIEASRHRASRGPSLAGFAGKKPGQFVVVDRQRSGLARQVDRRHMTGRKQQGVANERSRSA